MVSKPAAGRRSSSKSLNSACQPCCPSRSITSRRLPITLTSGLGRQCDCGFSSTSQSPGALRHLSCCSSSRARGFISDTGNLFGGQVAVFAGFEHLIQNDIANAFAMQGFDPIADGGKHALDLMVAPLVQTDTGFML